MAHCLKHKGNYSDEFWMLSFKVVPCTKTYAHSWSSCPCAHPGETARRRDPTLFNYQPVLCPNVKSKSGCPAGDSCGYAHNVFEQWLHPQRYKALMCTYGSQCTRPSCFFAHSLDELRVPWKGGPGSGSTAGGDQQQQQRRPGSSGNPGEGDAASGLGGHLGPPGMGGAGGGSGGVPAGTDPEAAAVAAAAAAGAAAARSSSSSSVPGHAAAAAAAAAGVMVGSAGSGSNSRSRLLIQASSGLQQQLQLQHGQGAGGLMSGGSGTHAVVDVRVVAGGSIQGLSSDHSLSMPFQPQHQQHHHHHNQQPHMLRRGTAASGSIARRPSVSTMSASAPYDLETATSVPVDSASLPGPGQLYRSHSNGSTLYAGLTEEVPLAGPGGGTGGGGGGQSTTVSGPAAAAAGCAPGTTADGATESTSATSLYQTPPSTSQPQLTVPGLASLGIYVGGNAAQGAGGSGGPGELVGAGGGGAAAAAAGPGMPGGRPLPLGAPQLQQHLQQLHQHQQQMQLQHHHQQQQQPLQAHRTGPAPPVLTSSGSFGRSHLGSSHQLPQHHHHHHQPSAGSYRHGGGGSSGPAAWVASVHPHPHPHSQQHSGGFDFGPTGGGGGTASLDFTSVPPNTTSFGMQSTNLLDMSEEVEPSGLLSGGWVPVALPTSNSREGIVSLTAFSQPPNQQQQSKQGLALGPPGPYTGNSSSSGGHPRLTVSRSFSPILSDDSAGASAAAAEQVRQQVQQLQLGGQAGAPMQSPAQQQQQQQQPAGGQDAATAAAAAAAAVGILALGDGGGGGGVPQQGIFADAGRTGFRRHAGLHLPGPGLALGPTPPTSTSPSPDLQGASSSSSAAAAAAAVSPGSAARIDPDVEMLLLSSLQLQLNHAGAACHPVVSSFPARNWLRQALQGRAQTATRMYLLDLLAQYMPPDQLAVIRRLVDCLEDAGALLSCFAGSAGGAAPAAAAAAGGPPAGGVAGVGGVGVAPGALGAGVGVGTAGVGIGPA
ncbi:hypothetical protein PLESTB_001098200 [Pleodorina starrii]|uniref:C3H1-type domain-containing protein n=1 Tax=Pleodorina starrii TaxID=330485 RepID=A0A9W6BQM6_9CHLO|nr:hypothetical protein PLESTB_001098200 [Pleodorina starrii]